MDAVIFWCFSAVCLGATAVDNVRKIGNMSEKIIVLTCGVLVGSAPLMIGFTLVGVLLLITLPPFLYFGISSWNKVSEEEPNSSLKNFSSQSQAHSVLFSIAVLPL